MASTRQQEQINELLAQLAALQQRLATVENQPANQNPVTASAPAPVYEENPFAGDVNPNSTNGMKLFQAATASREKDERLSATIAKSSTFIDAMRDDADAFGWGILTAQIGTSKHDMLNDFKDVNITKVRQAMNPIFHHRTDPDLPGDVLPKIFDISPTTVPADAKIFYQRVRANMIGTRIIKSLDKSSLTSLKLHENKYLWKTLTGKTMYDGPSMLQILIETVKPSLRTGVSDLKTKLRNSKLSTFNHDVVKMTDKMKTTYNDILKHGQNHDDYILDLFSALLTSNNETFHDFITREQDRYEIGEDILPEELIKSAVTKYNNMVTKNTWKSGESKDSKIVALTTQLKTLENKMKSNKSNGGSQSNSNSGGSRFEVEKWRFTKSHGMSTERDGKTWHWCSKHNSNKGMYVTHKEEDHDKRREKYKKDNNDSSTDKTSSSNSSGNKKSLTLSENLKAAMVSKFKCSSEEATKLWSDVTKNAKDF